ncbi:carboxylesterase/lipase family protein [Maribacter sp. MAR_2009_72]|uniref:carboxylesterase/lipase family protein n=1 Tax=Maribacter sp. MAR_2009_72 TaxID=1250050 RepID=UPI00119BA44F|nr:carboxylesterase family protein [Maribacter sp. MAR_2009_72]TVZ15656.1 para-nitrobenzyl esterase [Maribacter sp. MAR_2009_72]
MKYLHLLLCCLTFGCNFPSETIVDTDKGKIEGSYNTDKTVRIFKGIPFASPPVGNLRWKAPQPVLSWNGTLQCTEFGPSPIQNTPEPFYCWTEEFIALPEPLNEDCLYLNVWTTAKTKTEKQPVFVWIYGGGLSSGSANCAIYDGEELAKKGVVFVSFNYRVGILGFMAHPELTAESGKNASGNYGLMDQIAALKWVKNNIAAFGGDPNNVTIAGQSAGAFSVNTLIASPLSDELFHKAILQSGGLLGSTRTQSLADAEATGIRFMEKVKATTINELRNLPAKDVHLISNDTNVGRFGITTEGYVVPKDIKDHFKNGRQHQIPIISGWVTGDGNFSGDNEMTVEAYYNEAQEEYGAKASDFLTIFPAETKEDVKKVKSKLGMLHFAGVPSHLLATYNTQPTYLYQFGHVPPDKQGFPNYGAFHTSDVPYTLHTLHTWKRNWQPNDKMIEDALSSYWVNFAKTGNPNNDGLPTWKSYDEQTGNIMVIKDKGPNSEEGFLGNELKFLTDQ